MQLLSHYDNRQQVIGHLSIVTVLVGPCFWLLDQEQPAPAIRCRTDVGVAHPLLLNVQGAPNSPIHAL